MNLYIFPSVSTLNVEIAFEHKLWAVGSVGAGDAATRRTRALAMPLGARGLIYISSVQSFTMPFIVESIPEDREVKDVWPGTWYFPFHIDPLGFPSRRVRLKDAKRQWAALMGKANASFELQMSGSMAFLPSDVADIDWERIKRDLC